MRNADLALYRAKDEAAASTAATSRRSTPTPRSGASSSSSLRQAIGKQELLLNFQPVVDATGEHVVSFEALLRWNSAEHGFVSPGKFIPLAEDTRLIVPIGDWVLHEACREAARWPGRSRSRSTSRASSCSSRASPTTSSARWPTAACPRTGSRSR
jgi:predicted signal transduction protein with EAL and GGDEF domain